MILIKIIANNKICMKQLIITITLTITLISVSFAQKEWIGFTSSQPKNLEFRLTQSTTQQVKFIVTIPGIFKENINSGGISYTRLEIPCGTRLSNPGYPELPSISKRIAIPTCDSINISITYTDSTELNRTDIYPCPIIINDSNNQEKEVFYKNDSIYNLNQYFPQKRSDFSKTSQIRSQKVMEAYGYPIIYNPSIHNVKIYTAMEITVTFFNSGNDLNVETGFFNNILKNVTLNFTPTQLYKPIQPPGSVNRYIKWKTLQNTSDADTIRCDYLIIADHNFCYPSQSTALQNLAIHRADLNGFDIAIVDVQNILNLGFQIPHPGQDDNAEKIRSFIAKVFNGANARHTYDNKLAYVLLAGDAFLQSQNGVPTSSDYYSTYTRSNDYYFSCVTCDPSYNYDSDGDLFIGRIPADNENDLNNYVQKVRAYEREYNSGPWKKTIGYVYGTNDNDPSVEADHRDYFCNEFTEKIHTWAPNTNNSQVIESSIDPQWAYSYRDFINNQSCFLMMTMNHGQRTSWCGGLACSGTQPSDITVDFLEPGLNNDGKYPFVISQSCLTGSFNNSPQDPDCMGERTEVFGANKGYIAYIGSNGTTGLYGNGHAIPTYLYEYIPHSIFINNSTILGECMLESLLQTKNVWGNVNTNSNEYSKILFGDPALNLMSEGFEITQNFTFTCGGPSLPNVISTPISIENNAIVTIPEGCHVQFTSNGKITVQEGSTLIISNNVTIEGMNSNNVIIVKGTLKGKYETPNPPDPVPILNLTLSSQSSQQSSSSWKGIMFENQGLKIELRSANISNCELSGLVYQFEINNNTPPSYLNSSFLNTKLTFHETCLKVKNASFTNSNINISNSRPINPVSIEIANSSFNGSQTDALLKFDHISEGIIDNNLIQYESGTGLFMAYCGYNSKELKIQNNTISKLGNSQATTWGVKIYRTYAELYNNVITNNDYGVACMNYSHVSLKGNANATTSASTQQIINNHTQVRVFDRSFPYYFHHNIIQNSNSASDYLIYYDPFLYPPDPNTNPNLSSPLMDIKCNCLPSPPNQIQLYPSNGYIKDPSWCPGQLCLITNLAQDAYEHALQELDSGNFSNAESELKRLILNFPDEIYAIEAAKKLIPIKFISDRDFAGLKNFYDTSYNLHSDSLLDLMTERLKNQCDIEYGDYQDAITWYENHIQDPPTFSDSLYAIIDLEDLFILMMANSSQKTAGQIYSSKFPQYIPSNFISYQGDRERLINLLFLENPKVNDTTHTIPYDLRYPAIIGIKPNPFKEILSIEFLLPKDGIITFAIRNNLGITVLKSNNLLAPEGKHIESLDLTKLPSGVYILSALYNGKEFSFTKIIKAN